MKEIPLTQGKVAKVSDHRFDYLNQWKWHARKAGKKGGTKIWYAARNEGKNPHQKSVFMHRVIAGAAPDVDVDHFDGNGLNNQDENLRTCTKTQNAANRGKAPNNTSGYKGSSWSKRRNKWHAQIKHQGRNRSLGYFNSAEEAARAYDAKAEELFGPFARKNF
jgi:hypothetical protein